MKKSITRAIIDATVDRGLREIYEDPRRSIRKLADLGKQYNKGRFTQDVYSIFQDLLRNDDSPYYTAIEHLLQNTDRKNLKDFGINMGYNSFTIGGKKIRTLQETEGLNVPWGLLIRLNSMKKTGMTPQDLLPIIAQGKKLGIYTYLIRLEGSLSYFEDLLKVFITYDDCSFIFVLPDEEISPSMSQYIGECSNVLYFLPAFDDNCGSNIRILKKYRAWYGLYSTYNSDPDANNLISVESTWEYLLQDSAFLLTLAEDGTDPSIVDKTTVRIKETRLSPVVPLFIFDVYGDTMQIQKLISGNMFFFEIMSDGSFHTSNGDFAQTDGIPNLEKTFREIFP